jgi:hypothetical protein
MSRGRYLLAAVLTVSAASAGCGTGIDGPGDSGESSTPPEVSVSASPPEPTASAIVAEPPPLYVEEAHWAQTEEGPTLVVTPTDAARQAAGSHSAGVDGWEQLLDTVPGLAEHPARERLRLQFICHQQFATIAEPDKATWDLEADRPDVDYAATVTAHCNP